MGSPPSERCVSNIEKKMADKEEENGDDGGGWKSTAASVRQTLIPLFTYCVSKVKLVHFIHF